MKNLLLLFALLTASFNQAQTLQDVFKQHIKPNAETSTIYSGIVQIEDLCKNNPEEKCNKAIATGYYLLSEQYYQAGYQVFLVDTVLAKPVLLKAESLYAKANTYKPIEEFSQANKNQLIASKNRLESDPYYKGLK